MERKWVVERLGLVNPRLGTYCVLDVDELAMGVAGIRANDLFAEIVRHVSAGEVSK